MHLIKKTNLPSKCILDIPKHLSTFLMIQLINQLLLLPQTPLTQFTQHLIQMNQTRTRDILLTLYQLSQLFLPHPIILYHWIIDLHPRD